MLDDWDAVRQPLPSTSDLFVRMELVHLALIEPEVEAELLRALEATNILVQKPLIRFVEEQRLAFYTVAKDGRLEDGGRHAGTGRGRVLEPFARVPAWQRGTAASPAS